MTRIRRSAGVATFALLLVLGLAAPGLAQVPPPPQSIDASVPFTPVQEAYAEDFELDDGGWATSDVPPPPPRSAPLNPDWEWGVPSSGPGEAYSGEKAWAVNLSGFYRVPQCAAIMSPVIDLGGASSASVAFQHWVHMDMSATFAWHAGLLFATTDGGQTLSLVAPDGGYTSPGISTTARACLDGQPVGQPGISGGPFSGYQGVSANLDAFAGQQIQFLFAFGTDSSGTTFNGWYLDDFAVTIDGVTTVEDFESSDGGFTVTSTALPGQAQHGWSWGQPTFGPEVVGNVWGTNLQGNHGNGECHWVESPPIQLGAVSAGALAQTPFTAALLSWRQFFRTTALIGQGVLQVGTSDGSYTVVTPFGGYNRAVDAQLADCLGSGVNVYGGLNDPLGGPMNVKQADLTQWLGEEITLRFLFASRLTGTTNPGWYVDDVKVELGFGAAARVGIPTLPGSPEAPFTRVATLYGEDFEGSDGGWTESGTGEWDWGEVVSPPDPLPGSLNMWGTQVRGNHGQNACSWLTSPPISLPGAGGESAYGLAELAQMEFDLFVDTANRHNGSIVQVSADGGETWQYMTPNEGYDNTFLTGATTGAPAIACLGITNQHRAWTGPASAADPDAWRRFTVDLTAFMGEEVMVRFGFGSNATDSARRGVYLDRFVVAAGVGASAPEPGALGVVAPGWQVTGTNPSWLYGIPTTGPLSVRPGWATGLHDSYNTGECSAIVSRPVDTSLIPGLGRLELTLQHYFNTTTSTTHVGNVQVSTDDGATWSVVTPTTGYPVQMATTARDCITPGVTTAVRAYGGSVNSAYENVVVDLRQFEGQTIRVKFAFHSPVTTVRGNGWYLRDIGLTRGAGTVPLGQPGDVLPADVREAFVAAADPELVTLVDQGGQGEREVILTGPAHQGLENLDLDSRAEWTAWFDAQASGFFADVDAAVASLGGEVIGRWSAAPAVKVRAPLGVIEALPYHTGAGSMAEDHDDQVRIVDPIPDHEVGATNTIGRNQIQAEDIWDLGYMGEGIRIAVIDTGIDASHEAYKNVDGSSRITAFVNCIGVAGCISVAPFDDNGHGTHVGATAAGSDLFVDPTHGAFQEVGVAPRAELMGVKFLSATGGGSFADSMDALQWSFDNDADLTSNSWGGTCSAAGMVPVLNMVNNQAQAGMLTVAAVGNNGASGTPLGPACAKHAIAVGAVDDNEVIASFSTSGPCTDPTQGGFQRICPDLVAKGLGVRSAIPRSGATEGNPSGYRVWQGTSMSTPHLSGAVALIEQMKRDITGTGWNTAGDAERQILQMTAKPLGSPSPNNTYGYGLPQLVNVHEFLESGDSANVVASFSVNPSELWLGNSATLAFGVRNLGVASANGSFRTELEDPDGVVQVLDAAELSLGLFDARNFSQMFTVSGNVAPGEYTFRGFFDYSWTDGDGNLVEELIAREGTFSVNRVFMDMGIDGFEPEATLLETQHVTVSLENTGNENGQDVVLEFTVPDAYRFMPSEPLGLLDPNGQYSDPPPNKVVRDEHFGRTTLVYNVGSLPVGETFEVNLNLLPIETGRHWVRAVAKFKDGAGTSGLQSQTESQTVNLI